MFTQKRSQVHGNNMFASNFALAAALAALLAMASGAANSVQTASATLGENGRIAFENRGDIYAMNPDGKAQTNLTNNKISDGYPDWSPDGSKIAFARRSNEGHYDIYVMNSDGTGQNAIASGLEQPFEIDWGAAADEENTSGLTIKSVNLDGKSLDGL